MSNINKSFQLIRTNPLLTTNVKLVVSEKYDLFLESIESEQYLNQSKFKRFRLTQDNLLSSAIPKFFKNVPEDIAYSVKYDEDVDVMFKTFEQQIDPIYFSGAINVLDKRHDEEFEYFAPLHINPNYIPEKFIIFRVDGTGINNVNNTNFKEEIIDNLKVVKLFDLKNSILGKFLDNNFKSKYFPISPLELDFRQFEFSKWYGIDYLYGGYSSKSLFINDTVKFELPFYEFDKFITESYKKNSVIYPNLLNLTFLFNDNPATRDNLKKYSINRYLGFYIDELKKMKSVTSYKTYQLIPGGNILNNVFYSPLTSSSYDPIEGGWKEDKTYYVWYNNKFHYLTRTLSGTEYTYKIISDQVFDTLTDPSHTTDIFNETFTNPYTIKISYNETRERNELTLYDGTSFISTMSITEINSADVFVICINDKYHTFKYDALNDVFYIVTDYQIEVNEDFIKYWINQEDSENSVILNLHDVTKQNSPQVFDIYKLNFTEISDFDNDIKDTGFAGYEYEDKDNSDGIYKTNEIKFYPNDYSTNSLNTELVTDNPTSSEYIANDEYFAIGKDNMLIPLWRKNRYITKWGFKGSISHNDYPYRINNQLSNIDVFNRAASPLSLELKRFNHNLDYFYTFTNPTSNYTNHSLHINENEFNIPDYVNSNYDYFSLIFEKSQTFSDGIDSFEKNCYKYSVLNGGSYEDTATTVFRGAKYKINEVENILTESGKVTQINLIENNKFNDYKFSIIFASRKYNPLDSYNLYSGVEPEIGESGVDVYVNNVYKNILIHIYVNHTDNLPDVFEKERDYLYRQASITNSNTLTPNTLMYANFVNHLNNINVKNGFDNYINYYNITEDGITSYNKTSLDKPYFYITVEVPQEFEVLNDSLITNKVNGPNLMHDYNQPLHLPGNQPLARKFQYNRNIPQPLASNKTGLYPVFTNIYRFNGQYSPIFKNLNLFKSFENNADEHTGNYIFNTNLLNFGINKEQIISKVNRSENVLKLKDDEKNNSVYPLIDEFGYCLKDMFIFKSTWDMTYYTETINNLDPISETIVEDTKISYISKEFDSVLIPGTYNMKEQKSFFGSKMMDLEDYIIIDEKSITFLEETNGEQTSGGGTETLNTYFDFNVLKNNNHSINQTKLQTDLQRKEITKWTIDIDSEKLLIDYLYSKIKNARTFENVLNINTNSKNVNIAIKDYIKFNLLDRYEISDVKFYARYYLLEDNPEMNLYEPLYNLSAKDNNYFTNDISLTGSIENNDLKIEYTQSKNSLDYKFDYYFDLIFTRT